MQVLTAPAATEPRRCPQLDIMRADILRWSNRRVRLDFLPRYER